MYIISQDPPRSVLGRHEGEDEAGAIEAAKKVLERHPIGNVGVYKKVKTVKVAKPARIKVDVHNAE